MKKKVLLLGMVALVAAGIFGYRYWQQQRSVNGGDALTLYGNVDIRKVDLGFRVGGRIAQVAFEEGDKVRRGDRVAVLDQAPYENEVALARAARDRAAAERNRLERGSRPQEIRQARAQVAEYEASLRAYQEEFQRSRVLVAKMRFPDSPSMTSWPAGMPPAPGLKRKGNPGAGGRRLSRGRYCRRAGPVGRS
jgi:HlyD family secretion protein